MVTRLRHAYMKSIRRFLPLFGTIVFGALIWLAVYAYQEGFTKKWRKLIVKEFAKHNLNISFDKLTIDPFQGLVANDVVLLDGSTKQEVAQISKVRLDLDLPKLIREERFLQRIELESADLSIPYDRTDPKSKRLELRELQAIVSLTDTSIEIINAQSDFYGVTVQLAGTLLRPLEGSKGTLDWNAAKIQEARHILEKVVEQVKLIESKASPPVVNLILKGDLMDAASLELETRLDSGAVRYRDFEVASAEAKAMITRDSVQLEHLSLVDQKRGRLDANGTFPLRGESREATIAVNSSIDLSRLARAISPESGLTWSVSFSEAPSISMEGTLQLDKAFDWSDPPVDLIGKARSKAFQFGDEPFEGMSAHFHIQGPKVFVRDMRLQHVFGDSEGKLMSSPDKGIQYEFALNMDPTLFKELPVPESTKALLERWKFHPRSGVVMEIAGYCPPGADRGWTHRGRTTLTECRFETIDIERLKFDFSIAPDSFHFSNIDSLIKPDPMRGYPGGHLTAVDLHVDEDRRLTELTDLQGFVLPSQIVRCFSPSTADHIDRYVFSQPPEINIARGVIDSNDGTMTDLSIEIKSGGRLTTELFGKPTPLDQAQLGLHFRQNGLAIRIDSAGFFEGELSGLANIDKLGAEQISHTAQVQWKDVEFEALAKHYFPEDRADGQLTGAFAWSGHGFTLDAIDGSGVAHLLNSSLLEVPVLGPVSELTQIVIGKTKMSHGLIRDLGARYSIKDSLVTFEAIAADLGDYRLDGSGTLKMPSEALDLEVSLTNQAAPAPVLNLLYDIFGTYRCSGTLSDPKWKLVNRLNAKGALNAIEELGDPGKAIRIDPDKLLDLDPTGTLEQFLKQARSKLREEDR